MIQRAVLDTNVIYPVLLRDTLLRLAEAGLYQVFWSEEILEELRRNLLQLPNASARGVEKLISAMRRAFPEAEVSGYERRTLELTNDVKDRHVVAAALQAEAKIIVTENIKDFKPLPDGMVAMRADVFLTGLLEGHEGLVISVLEQQQRAYTSPSMTWEGLMGRLQRTIPGFVAALERARQVT